MILYKQDYGEPMTMELDLADPDLKKDMEKTRKALEVAYSGFNNCTDFDMIDSYVFEINALQRRYHYLSSLMEKECAGAPMSAKRIFTLPGSLFQRKRSPH